jgi:TetR/AcrR family transcriptional regulator, transcriptional repressor for nem operon
MCLNVAMVRTKQFDKHTALDEAMELFWQRGYHATSIQDLVDHLGVNRQSLYDTYGGKDQLFLAALERYREIQAAPVRRLLERDGPAREIVRDFFRGYVEALLSEDCKGCFMVNTATEVAGNNEVVAQVCSANARQFEATLSGLLVRALTVEACPFSDEHDERTGGDGQGHSRQKGTERRLGRCARHSGSVNFFVQDRLIVPI